MTLAVAKRDTVNRLWSEALINNAVSLHEFDIILSEFEQYNILKEQVRAKLLQQSSNRKLVDADKLEKEICCKVEAEILTNISKYKVLFAHEKEMIVSFRLLNVQVLFINMIVCFHLVVFLVNEYFTPEWQKNVRDITR